MSDIDPTKMKVAELREELKARGLDTKGVKAVLAKRLMKAITEEAGEDSADVTVGELDTTHEESDSSFVETPQAAPAQTNPEPVTEIAQPEPEAEPEPVPQITEPEPTPEPVYQVSKAEPTPDPVQQEPEPIKEEPPQVKDEPKQEEVKVEIKEEAIKQESDTTSADIKEETNTEVKTEVKDEPMQEDVQNGESTSEQKTTDEPMDDSDDKDRGRKRKRSTSRERRRSRSGDGHRSHSKERRHSPVRKPVEMDDESWETGTDFMLDRYNCDLNLRIDDNGVKAQPLSVEGFAFMWAGARTMFGVTSGKIAYEVKLLENLNVDHLPPEESDPHVLRVGYSVDSTSLQLGEEEFSYGYGGTGKASTKCEFKDFGEAFTQGDVITAYLDLDSDTATISYSKNGTDLGICFEIEKSTIEGRAMFPHVLTKNTEFECNFGKREEPYFPLKEDYVFIEDVSQENRVRGATPPAKKEECEMIMMVGLPGAGKTTWANKHAEQNPDKKYNMLGTNNIIDKMKVMGLPRKRNYTGRWDVLIDMSTKCLNRAIEIAARKKRNYILDQTNVYGSARRRKMQPFEGFQRKAVVILPSDEDFKSRIAQREKEEGKDIPEKAVLDMKANFTLPEEGTLFDSVEFVELGKEEAEKLTETYRKEGLAANPERRWRDNRWSGGGGGYRDYRRGGNYYDNRDRYNYNRNSGGYNRDYRQRNYYDKRSGSGGYGNYGSGGYRNDRYDKSKQGSYNKYDRSSSDRRSDSYSGSNWGKNQNWGNQGQWGQGQWNQNQWGQGYGNSGWGGYGQSSNYNNWNQGWGQNYWQQYPQGQQSGNVQDYSQWYGQYSNNSGGSGSNNSQTK